MNQVSPPELGPHRRLDRYLPIDNAASEQPAFRVSLGDLRAPLWRQRKMLAAIVAAAFVLGLVVTLLMTPRYTAEATVRIDNESVKIVEGQDLDPVVALSDTNRYLNTQKRIVESRSLATAVVDALKLDRDDRFLELMGESPPSDDVPAKQRAAERREQVIAVVQENVAMVVSPDSRVATITFNSRDPQLAARIANSFAENYIAQNVRAKFDTNAYARKVLNDQVQLTRIQLQDTERQAIEYARRNRLIDTGEVPVGGDGMDSKRSVGDARSVTTANLVQLNAAYMDAREARIAAEARWRAAQASNGLDLPEARQNTSLQALVSQRGEAASKLAELRARYHEDQPPVQEAVAQLGELDRQIGAVAGSLKSSVRNEYLAALEEERELTAAKEQLASETLTEQDRRVQLNLISRDANTQRNQLNDLLTRLNQINAAADITLNNISLLDKAQVPEDPVSPDLQRNLLIALAGGLVVALLVAFAREALDDTLRSPEDAESKLHLPLLGTTPYSGDIAAQDLVDQQGDLAEAYYSIRATIDYSSGGATNKILLVTSSQPSEGKTTTAIALAIDFAQIGRSVLLIDADMRKPSLHRQLGLARDRGLIDVLMKHAAFDDVRSEHEVSGLHVLPLGPVPPNPVQLLSSNLLGDFLASIRGRYDVIILDSAPVMGLADAPMLSRVADHVVMIIEANRAHYGQAKSAVRRLQDAGANILGIVMSKFRFRDAGYGYDYHYSYYSYRAKPGRDARN